VPVAYYSLIHFVDVCHQIFYEVMSGTDVRHQSQGAREVYTDYNIIGFLILILACYNWAIYRGVTIKLLVGHGTSWALIFSGPLAQANIEASCKTTSYISGCCSLPIFHMGLIFLCISELLELSHIYSKNAS
jgi:hypothetical protein